MKCPICSSKVSKKDGVCRKCGFRFPPSPSFAETISYITLPKIITAIISAVGLIFILIKIFTPSGDSEPIFNGYESSLKSNVGIILFEDIPEDTANNIQSTAESMEISENAGIKYKYNTNDAVYISNIDSLINQKCEDIIITSDKYPQLYAQAVQTYPETDFYLIATAAETEFSQAENSHIISVNFSNAVYAQGYIMGRKLADMTTNTDTQTPGEQVNLNGIFLYKNDESYSMYESFAAGLKQGCLTSQALAVKPVDEAAYAQELKSSADICVVYIADDAPIFTKAVGEYPGDQENPETEKIFISGMGNTLPDYSNYLSHIQFLPEKCIEYILNSIADSTVIPNIYTAKYSDGFYDLKINTAVLPTDIKTKAEELLKEE